jgi:hypothetical protein
MAGVISVTATIAAIASVALAAAAAAVSFAEKKKAEERKRKAEADAARKLAEAKEKLKVNYADELGINKEPYEREREAMVAAGAQIMEAAIESERGGGAVAGKLLAAQQEGQGNIRDQQSMDLFNLEAAQAQEDSRLRDITVGMDLNEVAGAQRAAAEAQEAANIAKSEAVQGIGNTLQAAVAVPALYSKTKGTRAFAKAGRIAKRNDTTIQAEMAGSFSPIVETRNFNANDVLSGKQTFGDVNTTTTGGYSEKLNLSKVEFDSMTLQEQQLYMQDNPDFSRSFFDIYN